MTDEIVKQKCPTCGQPMDFIKSVKSKDEVGKPFKRFEIWHCLNCSEEWELDIMDNIWRKNAIIQR